MIVSKTIYIGSSPISLDIKKLLFVGIEPTIDSLEGYCFNQLS